MLYAIEDTLSQTNLIAEEPEAAQVLSQALDEWDQQMSKLWDEAGSPREVELSDDTKAQLEALGYLD